MAFEGLDLPIGKETPKYITLEVNKLEDIIINSINKVYGSHIGYITKQLKEALIENRLIECTCECHDPNVQMMHCFPCCNDGWEFPKKPNKK